MTGRAKNSAREDVIWRKEPVRAGFEPRGGDSFTGGVSVNKAPFLSARGSKSRFAGQWLKTGADTR
jgi:hypothetical protein